MSVDQAQMSKPECMLPYVELADSMFLLFFLVVLSHIDRQLSKFTESERRTKHREDRSKQEGTCT